MKLLPKEKRPKIPPFDPEKVVPRLPDEMLAKIYGWRLEQNDCRNRGFVLDGYPTTYEQASHIFMRDPPLKED